jgi:ketosteroid isomerase-like protein
MWKNSAGGVRRRFYPALVALSFLVAGSSACQRTCGPDAAHSNVDAEAAAIQSVATEWFKAIAAKDLERTLSFYAPDAQYLAEGRPAASTPEERRKLWVEDYATPGFSSDEATTKIEVARSGELAYQRGTYLSKAQNEQGRLTATTGKFLVVWRKQTSGDWKAIIDIDNADQ